MARGENRHITEELAVGEQQLIPSVPDHLRGKVDIGRLEPTLSLKYRARAAAVT